MAADTTEYQYDARNRLTTIVYKGSGSKNEVTSYTWDNDSRLTQKLLPNGVNRGQTTFKEAVMMQLECSSC